MPKRTPKKATWTPYSADRTFLSPLGPQQAQPGKKTEPAPWPLLRSLDETAEELVRIMNTHPKVDPPDPALHWAVTQYAEYGVIPFEGWPNKTWREEAESAISGFRFYWFCQPMRDSTTGQIFDTAKLAWKYFGPAIGPDRLMRPAFWWLALAVLQAHGTTIRRCPNTDCRRFFTDPHHRGKTVCSPKCGNRLRAIAHYEKLKANPRKYHAHLKKQKALMKARRAAAHS